MQHPKYANSSEAGCKSIFISQRTPEKECSLTQPKYKGLQFKAIFIILHLRFGSAFCFFFFFYPKTESALIYFLTNVFSKWKQRKIFFFKKRNSKHGWVSSLLYLNVNQDRSWGLRGPTKTNDFSFSPAIKWSHAARSFLGLFLALLAFPSNQSPPSNYPKWRRSDQTPPHQKNNTGIQKAIKAPPMWILTKFPKWKHHRRVIGEAALGITESFHPGNRRTEQRPCSSWRRNNATRHVTFTSLCLRVKVTWSSW